MAVALPAAMLKMPSAPVEAHDGWSWVPNVERNAVPSAATVIGNPETAELTVRSSVPAGEYTRRQRLTMLSVHDNITLGVESLRDHSLDTLLELDGDTYFVDPEGRYRVNFRIKRVPVSPTKPHGIDYSLTLHDSNNHRIAGFDNAHPVRGGLWKNPFDHFHRRKTAKAYVYSDAAALLEAFWRLVDDTLFERGVRV